MSKDPAFVDRLRSEIETRCALLGQRYPGELFDCLKHLPGLYRFLWRLAFDMQLAPRTRHYAASLAFYIYTALDYVSEDTPIATGYLDDLAVSVRGLRQMLPELSREKIAEHWRDSEPIEFVLADADGVISRHLPDRIESMVTTYIKR